MLAISFTVSKTRNVLTIGIGVCGVTLTSIGAGALGVIFLVPLATLD
jgi:hypothetical protein